MFLTVVIKDEHASNDSDSSFLLCNSMLTNTTSSLIIKIQIFACSLHGKFASFCTPYLLRYSIEIFSDYVLLLDVTILNNARQIEFFKFYIQTGSKKHQ